MLYIKELLCISIFSIPITEKIFSFNKKRPCKVIRSFITFGTYALKRVLVPLPGARKEEMIGCVYLQFKKQTVFIMC